ncbi:sigma-70 family RNA polymerase sigma factor [bacterium]|nr:sigma-70 family RNA polymerase sigma factor [bacterium]
MAQRRLDDRTDHELLQAAGDDIEAFGVLVRRHQAFVFGAAMRVVKDPVLAEDIAQEAFIKAYKARDSFRGDSQVRTWMYRITTNLALNAVTRRRETPVEDGLLETALQVEGPSHAVIADEQRAMVRAAIDRLPDKLKVPLVLREFEYLSYEEISDSLDIPLNTVRTRILRARRSLRADLEVRL